MIVQNKKRDIPLLLILLVFNFWSGATTILGAQQILPNSLAIICGSAVQIMLFGLLSGWLMKYAKFRKIIAILVFSTASIYTSFFCYYDVLVGDINNRDSFNSAYEQHQQLKANILTPIEQNYIQLNNELNNLERLAEQECDFGITTGQAGCGPKYRSIKLRAGEKKIEVENANSLFTKIQDKFETDIANLTPDQIYKNDLKILALVPQKFRKNYTLDEDKYNKSIYDVSFLTPFYKVFSVEQRDPSAVFALIIAIVVDGMAIIQGTAIQKGRDESFFTLITNFCQSFVKDLKSLYATLIHELNSKSTPAQNFRLIEKLNSILEDIEYETDGNAHIFLKHFNSLVEIGPPHYLSKKIKKYPAIFQDGFKQIYRELILEKYCEKIDKKTFELNEEGFTFLSLWLNESIHKYNKKKIDDSTNIDNNSVDSSSSNSSSSYNNEINSWDKIIKRKK